MSEGTRQQLKKNSRNAECFLRRYCKYRADSIYRKLNLTNYQTSEIFTNSNSYLPYTSYLGGRKLLSGLDTEHTKCSTKPLGQDLKTKDNNKNW